MLWRRTGRIHRHVDGPGIQIGDPINYPVNEEVGGSIGGEPRPNRSKLNPESKEDKAAGENDKRWLLC